MLQAACHQLLVTLLLPYHGWVAMMLALQLVQHPRMMLMAKATSANGVGQKRMYYWPMPLLSYRQMSSHVSNAHCITSSTTLLGDCTDNENQL